MALTQQQLDATRKYKAGDITSDQYKQAYVTNYDPTKDPTAGKNLAYVGNPVEEALKNQIKPVEPMTSSVVSTPQEPQAPVYKTPDYTGQISAQYGEATNAAVAKLKQAIAESKAKQQGIIGNAPKQFDPLRSQSELAKGQQLRSVLERNSLLGDRGGVGRSAALQTQTAGENRLNSINLQQQQVIDTANQEIANLESRGLYEEANIRSQQKLAELQALMQESQRQDEIARRSQETLDTRAYNEGLTAQENAREDAKTAADRTREDFINTIGGIRDYTAQINTVQNDGDPSNDWQIPFLQQAKQEKIVNQNLDPRTGLPLPVDNTPQITSSSAAIDLWKQLGTANQSIANALGIPVGTRYTAQATGSSGSRSSGSSSTSPIGSTPAQTYTPKQIIAYAESELRGSGGSSAAERLVALNDTGVMDNLTPAEIKTLMNKFGVTEQMIAQAENRIEAQTSGVTLPSGRVTVPTNPNLLVR